MSAALIEAGVQLIGIAKLEKKLDISRMTIWRLCSAGKFPPPLYIGTRRFWRLSDVEAWIEDQARAAPAPAASR